MADEEAGISRCGISGYFDENGNPAALASGWLQRVVPLSKKKRQHLYYVLTPTYLAYFLSEDHAEISEQGFMYGNADFDSTSDLENHGARIELSSIESVDAVEAEGGLPLLRLQLRQGSRSAVAAGEDGVLLLECANVDIASGWAGAIESQAAAAEDMVVPVRTLMPLPITVAKFTDAQTPAGMPAPSTSTSSNGAGGSGGSSSSSGGGGGGGGLFSRGRSLLSAIGLGGGPKEPPRGDSEYVVLDWWQARSIDLQTKECAQFLEDHDRHPAAVLHGWLTKRNKSGVRTGIGERERYFVLTPSFLAFFPDERVAGVNEGYLFGRAEGTKTGLFGRTGGRLPLESVCEVRLLTGSGTRGGVSSIFGAKTRAVASRRNRRLTRRRGSSSNGGEGGDTGSEVDDEEEDEGAGAGAGEGSGAGAAATSAEGDEFSEDGGDGAAGGVGMDGTSFGSVCLFEVDFGDVTLVCNAHNALGRAAWVKGIRRWSAWRKRQVDEAMFLEIGAAMAARAAGEGGAEDDD